MFIHPLLHSLRSKGAALRAQLRAAERRFHVKLQEGRAGRAPPMTYKSLVLEDAQLHYVNLSGQVFVVVFDDIDKVEFVRREALFPDLWGPSVETIWIIHVRNGFAVELMDEEADRKRLVRAFARELAGFQEAEVAMGLASEEEGAWECFNRGGPHAATV